MLSFRTKLQLGLVALALVLMGSSLVAIRFAAASAVRTKIETDFTLTQRILAQQVKAQVAAIDDAVDTALGDPLFRSQLGRVSARTDESGLEEESADDDTAMAEAHAIFLSADLPIINRYPGFAVLNADGQRIFSKVSPSRSGDNLSRTPIIGAVRASGRTVQVWGSHAGMAASGIVPSAGAPAYLVVAREVRVAETVLGYLVVAEGLSAFMEQLQRASGAAVGLRFADATLASNDSRITSVATMAQTDRVVSQVIDGERFMLLETPLTVGEVKVVFLRSLDAEVRPLMTQLDLALLVVLLFSIAISVPVASLLARKLTTPLASLEKATRQLEAGDFFARAEVTSQDELGRVGTAFNEMIVALRERNVDPTTGAYTRRFFLNALEAQMLRSDTLGAPVSVILADVDHFRALNEKHGRVACDAVLKGIVRLAHETSGRGDVVARYSEDELVILLQDADGQAARTRASALQEAVAAREFTSGTDRIKCAISVAVAERTTRWATAHDLLLAADRALYAVKTARVS